MGYNKLDRRALVSREPLIDYPLHYLSHFVLTRAGIHQKRLVLAKEQIEKGLLIMRTAGLAENIEIFVVFVYLKLGDLDAFGSPDEPRLREYSGSHSAAIGLR